MFVQANGIVGVLSFIAIQISHGRSKKKGSGTRVIIVKYASNAKSTKDRHNHVLICLAEFAYRAAFKRQLTESVRFLGVRS